MREFQRDDIHDLNLALRDEAHVVTEISGDDDASCRLHEMGFGAGVDVAVERTGNPAIVRVGSSRVAMSSDLMDRVSVRCTH